jgi:hypothetical protein
MAKLADARDLKSRVLNRTYRFNSGSGHQQPLSNQWLDHIQLIGELTFFPSPCPSGRESWLISIRACSRFSIAALMSGLRITGHRACAVINLGLFSWSRYNHRARLQRLVSA